LLPCNNFKNKTANRDRGQGALFKQFLNERRYLKNVTADTIDWYETAFKAFRRTPPPPRRLPTAYPENAEFSAAGRSRAQHAAENLFLRKRLALYSSIPFSVAAAHPPKA